MVHLARCCTPVPGDQIVGFVTQGRGVSVHRADCSNAAALSRRSQERLIEVEWDRGGEGVFLATVEVRAFDRSRLLADVSRVVSEHHLNIVAARTATTPDRVSRMAFDVELADPTHLAVADRLAQAPRRRLRRLPPAPRQEGVRPTVTDERTARARRRPSAPAAPAGHPRRPVARVDALGAPRGRLRRARSKRAGYGLTHTPMFEDARGVPPGHRGRQRRRGQGDVRVRPTAAAGCLALRPEGTAPVVRAFVQHRPPLPWKAWYVDARRSATSGRRPAGTASTTRSGWRPSGRPTPTSTSR